ncbi:MAG: hypothetical protein AAB035_02205 [Nitrospirota bacterium]
MRFEFEKLSGAIYPAYLHVGDYSISLEPELIAALKKIATASPSFFENVLRVIETGILAPKGGNRYLKEMMESGIVASDDKTALSKRLYQQIQSL